MSGGTEASWDAFGAYLRSQRQLAQLSLRQLSALTRISNPYLSQIERGLHQPSIGILKSLAEALNLSVSELLAHAAGVVAGEGPATTTEVAIRTDPRLNDAQKSALLAVYASMADATAHEGHQPETEPVTDATAAQRASPGPPSPMNPMR